jgi:hypothetical protein
LDPGKTDLLIDGEGNLHRWPQGEPIPADWQKAPVTTTEIQTAAEKRRQQAQETKTDIDVARAVVSIEKAIDDPAISGFMDVVNRAKPDSNEFYIQTIEPPITVPENVPVVGGKEVPGTGGGTKGQKVDLLTAGTNPDTNKPYTAQDIYDKAEELQATPEEVLILIGAIEE